MPKQKEFQTEEDYKKPKRKATRFFTRCYKCGEKLDLFDDSDFDLQLAHHMKRRHDMSYPAWAEVVWDNKPQKPRHEKKQNWKTTT